MESMLPPVTPKKSRGSTQRLEVAGAVPIRLRDDAHPETLRLEQHGR